MDDKAEEQNKLWLGRVLKVSGTIENRYSITWMEVSEDGTINTNYKADPVPLTNIIAHFKFHTFNFNSINGKLNKPE